MNNFIDCVLPGIFVCYTISLIVAAIHIIIGSYDTLITYVYRSLVALNLIFTSLAFYAIIYSFLLTDLSILNVIQNSHSDLPIIFKIGSSWSNHEGSMVLWIWISSLVIFLFMLTIALEKLSVYKSLGWISTSVNLYFYVFLIHTSLPTLRTTYSVSNGAELSPILQDILLVIHPPLIYTGYILTYIPFFISLFILVSVPKNQIYESLLFWRSRIINWTLASLIFLTIGITLGSWWAYYELGWGGWWFWDPVENASLMPWIAGLILLHRFQKFSQQNYFLNLVIMVLPFFMSIVGTSMVRSGFLESVHSFAQDAHRGVLFSIYILGLLVLLGYFLYKKRPDMEKSKNLGSLSMERISVVSSSFALIVILVGTFYPSLHKVLYGEGVTVGFSFFHNMLNPLILILLYSICLNVCLKGRLTWNKYIFISSGYLSSIAFAYLHISHNMLSVLLSCSMYAVAVCTIYLVYDLLRSRRVHVSDLAHLSFLMLVLSICLYACYKEEFTAIVNIGDLLDVGKYKIYLSSYDYGLNNNYTSSAIAAEVSSSENNFQVISEKRYYFLQNFYSSKPDVLSSFIEDIYVIAGDGDVRNGWEYKVHINVGMSLLWISSIIMSVSLYSSVRTGPTNVTLISTYSR